MTEPTAANLLGQETSPYLRQHADNPVHWRAWNDAALAEARTTGKPILLSIGYSACHWCHVMAHECFEDPAIAAVMNELFVNIKVDREERPDLDTIYQHALALMGVQGGWPLTMFCTPAAEPFWGGTYFPPRPFGGRPGFADILRKVAEIHATKGDEIAHNVGVIRDGLARISGGKPGPRLDDNDLGAMLSGFAGELDPVHGGLHGAPKFPMVPVLNLAWQAADRAADPTALEQKLLLTADHMAMGGIYDHLGGGFARYSVDDRWLVPHFEKMLYDNAQLITFYSHLWRQTRAPLYAQRVAETIDWATREMLHDGGAFYAALDADSEGVEGKFYVWTEAEIRSALGPEADLFCATYDVTPHGNFEGRTILNRLADPRLADDDIEARLADARARLLAQREDRVRPGRDDKILTDWNGLMISGLVEAGLAFERHGWLAVARRTFDFVLAELSDGPALFHTWQDGRARFDGMLEDYANMIHAALELHEATGDPAFRDRAVAWADYVESQFAAEDGGYYQSDKRADDLISRSRICHDQPNPSGNGRMAENYARLYYLTGEADYRARAEAVITFFAHEARGHPVGLATLIAAADLLARGTQIVVAAPDPETDAESAGLRRVAFTAPVRRRIVLPFVGADAGGATLPRDHPAYGKGPVDGKAAAYVCRGQTCSLPIADPATLEAELAA